MTTKGTSAAIIGSTLGLAAGDCLGAALEGGPPPDPPVRDFIYEPTVWTDDTQQALVLIEATVRLGRPDPDWVARRFAEMSLEPGGRFGLHRGTGRGFRAAVTSFRDGGDWRSSGRTDRAGNGASMRIAPVAVALAAREPGSWWADVATASIVTHREIRALAGALAVGWTAARLAEAQGYPLPSAERFRSLAQLGRWLRERERWLMDELPAEWGDPLASAHEHRHQVSDALSGLADAAPADRAAAFEWIENNASEKLGQHVYAGAGFVLSSVVSAIYLALCSDDNFEETLVAAVNMGGDVDTIGAIVGGMAGAAAGPDEIPSRWLRMAGSEDLLKWAQALARGEDRGNLPDLLELETRLSTIRRGG